MLKIDRQKKLLDALNLTGTILISDISKKLQCSEETIRRDLAELEKSHGLKRIHGGAYLPEDYSRGVPIQIRETMFSDIKSKIADIAYTNYIEEGEVIMLDSSTTCFALAKRIIDANIKITIITNSLRTCNLFNSQHSNIKLICTGGRLPSTTSSFTGYQTLKDLSLYVADKSFVSCPVVSLRYGLIDNTMDAASIRKTMLDHSRQKILLADHTKFYEKAAVIITPLNDIDVIITNKKLPQEWKDASKKFDIIINDL